jgi:hypothetical protein
VTQQFILHANDAGRTRVVANLCRFLESLPTAKPWKIEIAQYQKRRSDQQNRYLWGVVYPTFMAILPGWDAEDVHEYLLGEHFGWERFEGMGRAKVKPIKRSSKLSKIEFADYVDYCQRKGAEHGIFVPEPEDLR